MSDSRTFKKGEPVILYNGGKNRNSVELAQVGRDCSYASEEVSITHGAFNVVYEKGSVHKLPPTLKKAISEAQS